MLFIEIAAQGIKGCSSTTRAAVRPGYVVLKPPGAEAVPLGALTCAVLYSEGRGEESAFGARQGAKIAFTLQGKDHGAYRLVRELGGPGALQQLNKSAQKFETLTSDTLEMGQVLRGQIGAPQKSAFEYLYTLTGAQFPSRKPKKAVRASGAKPALQSAQPVTAASDVAQAQAKLRELEKELQTSNEIEKLQFEQDGIASQLFELESKTKGNDGLQDTLEETEAAFAAAPTAASLGLPEDILERVERYPTLAQKRDDALARLAQERESEPQPSGAIEPLWRDARFLAGVGMGLAFLVAGVLMREGLVRYVALLDIPAFGFAALVALKWVDDLQGSQRVGRKEGMFAAREKKIVDEFEAEAQHVKQAMSALGVESPQDVVDLLGRKALLQEKLATLRAELARAESDPAFASARAQYQKLKARSDAISEQLQARAGGYVRDAREIERELKRVRESIALATSGAAQAPAVEPMAVEAPAPGQQFEDPSPVLLSLAADLLASDLSSVAALIADRCAQYVAALTDRRYTAAQWDLKGNATLSGGAGGGKVAASDLAAKDLDLYFLALRLTLAEKLSAQGKIPFLVEDVLGFAGEAKQALVARMLKHLGTLTQVLHVTADPSYPPMADATATL